MNKILIDATPYIPGGVTGAGRIIYQLIAHLAQLDRENQYLIFGFAPRIWEPNQLPPNFSYRQIPLYRWLGPFAQELARRQFVGKTVTLRQVDVVHCTLEMIPLYDEHTKVLFSLYDLARSSPHFMYSAPQNLRSMARTFLRYRLARRADVIHTISKYSADQIASRLRIERGRIRIIYPGFDPRFQPGEPEPEVLRRHALPPQRYFLFVGEFGRQKNEEGLIRAFFAAHAESRLDATMRLALIGDPANLRESTRHMITQNPRGSLLSFLGRVSDEDLLHLYRGAAAVVLPSFYEGFGLPVLEAMACGIVPIVSQVTSLPEVVGDAGLIVPPGDVKELAGAMGRIAADRELREKLAERALLRTTQFSFSAMARAQLELYQEMCHD